MGRIRAVTMDDGGSVEFDEDARKVDIGNGRGVPERFSYLHPGGSDQPSFRFEFAVRDRIPVCVGVHIEAKDDVAVRTKDLKVSHIDKLVISAVGAVAHEAIPGSAPGRRGWRYAPNYRAFNADSIEAAKVAVKGKPRTRRSADDVDLELVADTWNNAKPGAKTEALMTVFFCSKATAARYKKRAVEEGYISD